MTNAFRINRRQIDLIWNLTTEAAHNANIKGIYVKSANTMNGFHDINVTKFSLISPRMHHKVWLKHSRSSDIQAPFRNPRIWELFMSILFICFILLRSFSSLRSPNHPFTFCSHFSLEIKQISGSTLVVQSKLRLKRYPEDLDCRSPKALNPEA